MTLNYFYDSPNAYADAIARAFLDMFGENIRADVFGGNWEKNEHSRAPYTDSWKLRSHEIVLFASPTLTHCCVEISGAGCEKLIKLGAMASVLECCRDKVTRIDIASDIETEIRPPEFVEQVAHERMRASGHQTSDEGETCYVGSKKSDRYARVYRYNAPHPRSHMLRIEHVFRRDYAKKVADACVTSGMDSVARQAGNAFGWSHALWQPEGSNDADISVVSPKKSSGSTVFWMVKQVAPAFKRLVMSGDIRDPQAFFETYFLPQ